MSLIKCPECKREISDKAKACIHCGYPIKDKETKTFNIIYNGFISEQAERNNKVKVIGQLRQLLNTDLSYTKKLIDNPPQTLLSGITKENAEWTKKTLSQFGCIIEIKENNENITNDINAKLDIHEASNATILCPKCGSGDVVEEQRGYSLFSGFLGSSKTMHRCKSCRYKW